jgi:S1-C subfamily serine protease
MSKCGGCLRHTGRNQQRLGRLSLYQCDHIAQASRQGLASGVLIDEQTSIMTNAHVMDGAVHITVTLHVGTRLPAELN